MAGRQVSLPNEVIGKVLRDSELSIQDLVRCTCVNRQFLAFARRSLYREITVRLRVYTPGSASTYLYNGQTWFLLRSLRNSPHLAGLVKTLKVKTYDDYLGVIDSARIVWLSSFFSDMFKLLANVHNLALDLEGVLGRQSLKYHHILKIRLSGVKLARSAPAVPVGFGIGKSIINPSALRVFVGYTIPSHVPFPKVEVLDVAVLPRPLPTSPRLRFLRTSILQPSPSNFSSLATVEHLSLYADSSMSSGTRIDFTRDCLSSLRTLSFECDVLSSKTNLNLDPFLHWPPPQLRRVNFLHPCSLESLVRFFRGQSRFAMPQLKEGEARYDVPELGIPFSFLGDRDQEKELGGLRGTCEKEEIELYFVSDRIDPFSV